MSQTEENAITLFSSGLNCAQAVLTAYTDKLDIDKSLAINISCGFGGGMGRLFIMVKSMLRMESKNL
jgi:hypothetical protein